MSDSYSDVLMTEAACPAIAYQSVSVCAPVTVTPSAVEGKAVTSCCGDPVVTPGTNICAGTKNGTCSFTISQNLCIAVPVYFTAKAAVGDSYVTCEGASADNLCAECHDASHPEDTDNNSSQA